MRKIGLLILIFLALPLVSFASGNLFFEFNPDSSNFLNVASLASPKEIFIPQNDFLGGFDFWFDNSGSSGTVTFELRNSVNTLLASRTVTVPTITPVSGGKRFHVDFSQIAVSSTKKYSISIITQMPDLRIYYSSRINLIGHNAPYTSGYYNGVAEIGSEEKEFSFKFGLYESFETAPPVLSNITTVGMSQYQTDVDFNANEPVDYRVDYGISGQGYTQSTNFSGVYKFCNAGISICSLSMATQANKSYDYLLVATDIWGNEAQFSGSFISGAGISTQSPTPSESPPPGGPLAISDFIINSVNDKSVEVFWHTNRAANSTLTVSYSSDLITITAVTDSTFELEHLLKTADVLSPSTTYFARVLSYDNFNNVASATLAFTTLKANFNTPTPSPSSPPLPSPSQSPVPSSSNQPPVNSQTPAPVVTGSTSPDNGHTVYIESSGNFSAIQWNTPSGGDPKEGYRVDIFDSNKNLVKQITLSKNDESATVSGLPDGQYYSVVYANNGKVLEKVAKPTNFTVGSDTVLKRLLAMWPYLALAIGALILFIFRNRILKLIAKKSVNPIPPGQ